MTSRHSTRSLSNQGNRASGFTPRKGTQPNQAEYASLPPGQIVPALAHQGLYIGSESSFYRVLHAHGQVHRRGRARPPQEPRHVPRLRASGANQVWSWDITYLPTTVRGIWLYLYLVIDVWSRKVVAWDVDEREDSQISSHGPQRQYVYLVVKCQ